MLYVGIDLHRKTSNLAVMDDRGGVVRERKVRSSREAIREALDEFKPKPLKAVFEATFGWGWLADVLAEEGVEAHMAHPLQTKAISAARVKNDSVDAKTLAHLLRTNLLPEAWIAPPDVREARRLVRSRAALVRIRARMKNQVHALLAEQGVTLTGSDIFGVAGQEILEHLVLPVVTRGRVDACLRLIAGINDEVEIAEGEMHEMFADDARVRQLLPIPGIGFLTAAMIVAEVWDITRFPNADALCSWAGLTPREHSSGEHTRRGHISKQGSRWLRWVLIEAASAPHAAHDPGLRSFRDNIARRRGKNIACVALARRLLTLAYFALRSPQGCKAYPISTTSRRKVRSLSGHSPTGG